MLDETADGETNQRQIDAMRAADCCGEILRAAQRPAEPFTLVLHYSLENSALPIAREWDPLHPGEASEDSSSALAIVLGGHERHEPRKGGVQFLHGRHGNRSVRERTDGLCQMLPSPRSRSSESALAVDSQKSGKREPAHLSNAAYLRGQADSVNIRQAIGAGPARRFKPARCKSEGEILIRGN